MRTPHDLPPPFHYCGRRRGADTSSYSVLVSVEMGATAGEGGKVRVHRHGGATLGTRTREDGGERVTPCWPAAR